MPDGNGNTITKAGDLNMNAFQRLEQPKRGVGNRMFQAPGGGKTFTTAGPSRGHGGEGSLAKADKNLKQRGTESPKERIDKLSKVRKKY